MSQSLSTLSQTSVAPGLIAPSESSQSVVVVNVPAGCKHAETVEEPPKPSASTSVKNVDVPVTLESASSMSVSQSLSTLSQTSVALGLTAPSESSQSVLSATKPDG